MNVRLSWHHRQATIHLEGELDIVGALDIRSALDQALRNGATVVSVDLGGVTFIDATGLSACMVAKSLATASGVRFEAVNPSNAVRRIVRLSGPSMLLTL